MARWTTIYKLKAYFINVTLFQRDADADAAYVYGVPFGSSTGLDPITQGLDPVTQGYAPYAAYGYPYAAHYGKREAEADAQVGVFIIE